MKDSPKIYDGAFTYTTFTNFEGEQLTLEALERIRDKLIEACAIPKEYLNTSRFDAKKVKEKKETYEDILIRYGIRKVKK